MLHPKTNVQNDLKPRFKTRIYEIYSSCNSIKSEKRGHKGTIAMRGKLQTTYSRNLHLGVLSNLKFPIQAPETEHTTYHTRCFGLSLVNLVDGSAP